MIEKQSSLTENVLAGTLTIDVQPNVQINVTTDIVKLYFTQYEGNQIIMEYELVVDRDFEYEENEPIGDYSYNESDNSFSYVITGDEGIRNNRRNMIKFKIPVNSCLKIESETNLIDLNSIEGKCDLENENGPIHIKSCSLNGEVKIENGPVDIQESIFNGHISTENGPVTLKNCQGESLDLNSENGQLRMLNMSYKDLRGESENGSIVCELALIESGEIDLRTENGPIKMMIPDTLTFNLEARTENAPIRTNDKRIFVAGGNNMSIKNSESMIFISLETENAPITLIHDKQLIIKAIESELNKADEYIQKITADVDVDEIRNTIEDSMKKVKIMVESSIDKGKNGVFSVIKNIFGEFDKDNIDGLKENLKEKKEEIKVNIKSAIDKIKDTEFKFESSDSSKKKSGVNDSKEQSRLKILELLEKGLITADDAEKLLKAIES